MLSTRIQPCSLIVLTVAYYHYPCNRVSRLPRRHGQRIGEKNHSAIVVVGFSPLQRKISVEDCTDNVPNLESNLK